MIWFCFIKAIPPPHFAPSLSALVGLIPIVKPQQPSRKIAPHPCGKGRKCPPEMVPSLQPHSRSHPGLQIMVPQNLSPCTSLQSLKIEKVACGPGHPGCFEDPSGQLELCHQHFCGRRMWHMAQEKASLKKNEKTKQDIILPIKDYAFGPGPVHAESETFHFFFKIKSQIALKMSQSHCTARAQL